jgi:hypothetical protein
MLALGRSETREMATLAGLPYVDDPMNEDPELARNRIRRTILPLLTELNPRVIETIARAGDVLSRDSAYIDSQVPEPDLPMVAVGVVKALPRPVADRLLGSLLSTAGVAVTSDRLSRMWAVARGEAPRHDLVDGRCVVRRGAMIVVE